MRHWLADVCLDAAVNLTDRAKESHIRERRARLIEAASIWHARSAFWSGLKTWKQHREAVRTIKERARRTSSVPTCIPLVQYGEG